MYLTIHHFLEITREGSKMKTRKHLIWFNLIVSALLALMVSTVYAANASKAAATPAKAKTVKMAAEQTTVSGVIVANKDKAGKIVSYALQEEGGQSLMLSKHGKGKELRKLVGQKVECTGTLQESKGHKWINVKEFKEIK
jgi:hypothetical protein